MIYLITTVHVIVCLFLAIVVLLQSGKAADLAGAFGGMGSQTVFGPRGSATMLSRANSVAAGLFMVTSLSLSIMSTRSGKAAPPLFKTKPAATQQQKGATVPAGQIPPISVTPQGGQTQSIPIPVQAPPPAGAPAKK